MYYVFMLFSGLEKIEYLQEHNNKNIYEKASSIIEQYFQDKEDLNSSDVMIQPEASADAFKFGASSSASVGFTLWFGNGCRMSVSTSIKMASKLGVYCGKSMG